MFSSMWRMFLCMSKRTFWMAFPMSAPKIFSKGTLSMPMTSTLLGPFFMMEPASSRPIKEVPIMATLVFSLMAGTGMKSSSQLRRISYSQM